MNGLKNFACVAVVRQALLCVSDYIKMLSEIHENSGKSGANESMDTEDILFISFM
jgi:hypothetical protein